jgi:hypothetical protein
MSLKKYCWNSLTIIFFQDITDLVVEVEFPDSNITENFVITGEEIANINR